MGATHFRMRTLKHVATEMALHVLAYMMQVIAILGMPGPVKAMRGVTEASCTRKCALRMSQDDVRAEDRPQAAETLPHVPIAPINDNTAPSHTASRGSRHRPLANLASPSMLR